MEALGGISVTEEGGEDEGKCGDNSDMVKECECLQALLEGRKNKEEGREN